MRDEKEKMVTLKKLWFCFFNVCFSCCATVSPVANPPVPAAILVAAIPMLARLVVHRDRGSKVKGDLAQSLSQGRTARVDRLIHRAPAHRGARPLEDHVLHTIARHHCHKEFFVHLFVVVFDLYFCLSLSLESISTSIFKLIFQN